MDALSESTENILTRRANQRHYSIIARFVKRPWPCPTTGSSVRLQAKNPYPQLKSRRLVTAKGRRIAIVPACMRAFQPGDVVYRTLAGVTARAELALAWRADSSSPIVKWNSENYAISSASSNTAAWGKPRSNSASSRPR